MVSCHSNWPGTSWCLNNRALMIGPKVSIVYSWFHCRLVHSHTYSSIRLKHLRYCIARYFREIILFCCFCRFYCFLINYFVWLHDTRKFFCHKISCYGVQELYGILQYTLKVKAELPKKPLKIMYDCSSMSKETAKDTLENGIPNVLGLNPK